MYYYFHILFKDEDADIYIVRVKKQWNRAIVEQIARATITKTILNAADFEIEEIMISKSLLARFVFIDNIAQLTIVTHP